jgi:ADP-ribose pyrophosphatase
LNSNRKRKRKSDRVKVVSSKVLLKGLVFGVKRDRVVEPDGIETTREWITHAGSVVVLPVFSDGRILMIRQYRHAVGQYLWELVAGHKEEGESFAQGARRELQEETGYSARRTRKLLEIFPSPGMLGERMQIFLADGLREGTARPEHDEKITQRIFTLREAEERIQSGKIIDAKSIAGILYYSRFLTGRRRADKQGPRVR